MTLLDIDVGESVGCELSQHYGVVIGTSALYFGVQAHDSWPRNMVPWQIFFNGFQQVVKMCAGLVL